VSELEAIVLGLVQGLTEFLPVSSSGHLVVLQSLFGGGLQGVVVEVVFHVATLGSVLLVYRRRVAGLIVGTLQRDAESLQYVGKLALATLPAVVFVLMAGDFLEAQLESPVVAGVGLLVTGSILWTTRRNTLRAHASTLSWGAALLIGCAQACAILPGISRSGATVATALALGVAPAAAAEFSFLMSVIAILGAAVRELPELTSLAPELVAPLILGALAALVSGIAAIWLFVRLLERRGFYYFAYYTWAAGAAVLVGWTLTGGW
jgi:undecaprenyl-diphosphatase